MLYTLLGVERTEMYPYFILFDMRIRNISNYDDLEFPGEVFHLESLTLPDQSYTIEQLLALSLKGVDPLVSRELNQYCDFEPSRSIDENLDDIDNEDIPESINDPTDADAFLESSLGRGRKKRESSKADDKRLEDEANTKTKGAKEASSDPVESDVSKLENV